MNLSRWTFLLRPSGRRPGRARLVNQQTCNGCRAVRVRIYNGPSQFFYLTKYHLN